MNSAHDHCSPNSIDYDFKLTFIDSRTLAVRLAAELLEIKNEMYRAWPAFRRDPIGVGRHLISRSFYKVQVWVSQPGHLLGFICAALVIGSLVGLIMALEQRVVSDPTAIELEEFSPGEAVMVDPTAMNGTTGGYDPAALGRVGLRHDKGEGSGVPPMRAQGGGSGGLRHATPEQFGKVPQPSTIPAPILNQPAKSPALPVAGIDIDPLLWTDIKYPAYGSPKSRSLTPSNGTGDGGGMGSNEGLGIGDGKGNGYGSGNNGNTGVGEKQIGSEGSGGAPGGMRGYERVFDSRGVDQKARLLSKPEPHYSEEARRSGISGTVVLRVVFTSSGEVTQIRAISTLPFGLTERAIAAARQIKFLPAMKGGHPVSVHMQLEYNFNLY